MIELDNDCLRNVIDFLPTEALMGKVSIVGRQWKRLAETVVRDRWLQVARQPPWELPREKRLTCRGHTELRSSKVSVSLILHQPSSSFVEQTLNEAARAKEMVDKPPPMETQRSISERTDRFLYDDFEGWRKAYSVVSLIEAPIDSLIERRHLWLTPPEGNPSYDSPYGCTLQTVEFLAVSDAEEHTKRQYTYELFKDLDRIMQEASPKHEITFLGRILAKHLRCYYCCQKCCEHLGKRKRSRMESGERQHEKTRSQLYSRLWGFESGGFWLFQNFKVSRNRHVFMIRLALVDSE